MKVNALTNERLQVYSGRLLVKIDMTVEKSKLPNPSLRSSECRCGWTHHTCSSRHKSSLSPVNHSNFCFRSCGRSQTGRDHWKLKRLYLHDWATQKLAQGIGHINKLTIQYVLCIETKVSDEDWRRNRRWSLWNMDNCLAVTKRKQAKQLSCCCNSRSYCIQCTVAG